MDLTQALVYVSNAVSRQGVQVPAIRFCATYLLHTFSGKHFPDPFNTVIFHVGRVGFEPTTR